MNEIFSILDCALLLLASLIILLAIGMHFDKRIRLVVQGIVGYYLNTLVAKYCEHDEEPLYMRGERGELSNHDYYWKFTKFDYLKEKNNA